MVSMRCLGKVGLLRLGLGVFNSETQRACSRNAVFSSHSHLPITLPHGGSRAEIAAVAFLSIRHPLGPRIARGAPPDSLLYHSDDTHKLTCFLAYQFRATMPVNVKHLSRFLDITESVCRSSCVTTLAVSKAIIHIRLSR